MSLLEAGPRFHRWLPGYQGPDRPRLALPVAGVGWDGGACRPSVGTDSAATGRDPGIVLEDDAAGRASWVQRGERPGATGLRHHRAWPARSSRCG